jgi:hypothetical protein
MIDKMIDQRNMVDKIIDQLGLCTDQELDLIAEKASKLKAERRNFEIKKLKENFLHAWKALEEMGVNICGDDNGILDYNDINFFS